VRFADDVVDKDNGVAAPREEAEPSCAAAVRTLKPANRKGAVRRHAPRPLHVQGRLLLLTSYPRLLA
jgi:hypothetical protein